MEHFEVLHQIGEGGYGVVLKCRCIETGDIVAIKKIKFTSNDLTDPRRAGVREIRMLKALRHVNIIELLGAFRAKSRLHLVFEYIERTLLELLNEVHPKGLATDKCRSFAFQLISAVTWCHSKDIVHRDIKPENLLITDQNVVRLCDFGFARILPSGNSGDPSSAAAAAVDETGCGFQHELTAYVATRWYRPPELILRMPYGKSVDVWGIGCILAEMALGDPLFPGDTDVDQLFLISKAVGQLSADQLEAMNMSPKFQFLAGPAKDPKAELAVSCLDRFRNLMGDDMHQLLLACVKPNPLERCPASFCYSHSCFELERRAWLTSAASTSAAGAPVSSLSKRVSAVLTKINAKSREETAKPKLVLSAAKSDNQQVDTAVYSKEEVMLNQAEVDLKSDDVQPRPARPPTSSGATGGTELLPPLKPPSKQTSAATKAQHHTLPEFLQLLERSYTTVLSTQSSSPGGGTTAIGSRRGSKPSLLSASSLKTSPSSEGFNNLSPSPVSTKPSFFAGSLNSSNTSLAATASVGLVLPRPGIGVAAAATAVSTFAPYGVNGWIGRKTRSLSMSSVLDAAVPLGTRANKSPQEFTASFRSSRAQLAGKPLDFIVENATSSVATSAPSRSESESTNRPPQLPTGAAISGNRSRFQPIRHKF